MVRAATQVSEQSQVAPQEPEPFELKHLHGRVSSRWLLQGTLEEVDYRDLKRLPWVLFFPPQEQASWLGGDASLPKKYSRWLKQYGPPSAVASLLTVMLRDYPTELGTFQQWMGVVRRSLSKSGSKRLDRWKRRSDAYSLLKKEGPSRLAKAWDAAHVSGPEFLAEAGFDGMMGTAAFLQRATEEFLRSLERQLRAGTLGESKLERLLEILEGESTVGSRLRYDALSGQIASSLLMPFSSRAPEPVIQQTIQTFLLRAIGDPRISRGSWHRVPEPARQVLMRWLVRGTLEEFFRLLDATALDRHWKDRKRFWSAYLDLGAISDAWIVLGSQARNLAWRRKIGEPGSWGRLDGAYEGTQSVLLMRLANVTIAEWSHNGRCCFWLSGNASAPPLYGQRYSASRLRASHGTDHSEIHHFHLWRRRVRSWLRRETGVSPR
jgi:hypothetical protein